MVGLWTLKGKTGGQTQSRLYNWKMETVCFHHTSFPIRYLRPHEICSWYWSKRPGTVYQIQSEQCICPENVKHLMPSSITTIDAPKWDQIDFTELACERHSFMARVDISVPACSNKTLAARLIMSWLIHHSPWDTKYKLAWVNTKAVKSMWVIWVAKLHNVHQQNPRLLRVSLDRASCKSSSWVCWGDTLGVDLLANAMMLVFTIRTEPGNTISMQTWLRVS